MVSISLPPGDFRWSTRRHFTVSMGFLLLDRLLKGFGNFLLPLHASVRFLLRENIIMDTTCLGFTNQTGLALHERSCFSPAIMRNNSTVPNLTTGSL